jgi:hypothetical protein
MTTITQSGANGLYLISPAYTNPVVIEAGVTIQNGAAPDAIKGYGPWTVQNSGALEEETSFDPAIWLSDSSITNTAAGTISGGVLLDGGGGVTNAGTITGAGRYAIDFSDAAVTNRLILDPGSVINDSVIERSIDPVTGYTINSVLPKATNLLELAAGAGGGLLANQGNFFTSLSAMTVDAGADWDLANATFLDSGALTDNGTITLASSLLTAASLTGEGAVTIESGGTLVITGAVSAGETIAFTGAGGVLILSDPSQMLGAIVGSSSGDAIIKGAETLVNAGSIAGANGVGVVLATGGSLTNQAAGSIAGSGYGVLVVGGAGAVVNDGAIAAPENTTVYKIAASHGVELRGGGAVTNAASASITGAIGVQVSGGVGKVVNDGDISGVASTEDSAGVLLLGGGSVSNEAEGTIVSGTNGVVVLGGVGTVANYGSITESGLAGDNAYFGAGVFLGAGGSVVNAASASIAGEDGIQIYGAAGTVVNDGAISGFVELGDGGSITNAASGVIVGSVGNGGNDANQDAVLNVFNFGSISSNITLGNGSITNATTGSISDAVYGGDGTVTNAGVIVSTSLFGVEAGVQLGGILINAATGSISGGAVGVYGYGDSPTIDNFGTITTTYGTGVRLGEGGTIIDAGAIIGADGPAVLFDSENFRGVSNALLALEPGAALTGEVEVEGDPESAQIELGSASNVGTISSLGNLFIGFDTLVVDPGASWDVTGASTLHSLAVSVGSGATLSFTGSRATISGTVAGAGTVVFAGANDPLDAGTSLAVANVRMTGATTGVTVATDLTYAGFWTQSAGRISIEAGDTLTFTGAGDSFAGDIDDPGTLALAGGSDTFAAGAKLTGVAVAISGASTLVTFATSVRDADAFNQSGGELLIEAGDTLTLTGAGNSFAGDIAGAGTLAFAGGGDTFAAGAQLAGAAVAISGASTVVTLAVSLTDPAAWDETGGVLDLSANALTLAGPSRFGDPGTVVTVEDGTLETSGDASVRGLTLDGGTRWNNVGTVTLSGPLTLGDAGESAGADMLNLAGATLDLTGAGQVVFAGSAPSLFFNGGTIVESGTCAIAGAVSNSGVIEVAGGSLDIAGAITDSGGVLKIEAGGALELGQTPRGNQSVVFAGPNAVLRLDAPSGAGAPITGFSAKDTIDLRTFAYSGAETVGFTENSAKTRGVLQIREGTQLFEVTLFGQYAAAGFGLADDHAGGSLVSYTPPPTPALPSLTSAHG